MNQVDGRRDSWAGNSHDFGSETGDSKHFRDVEDTTATGWSLITNPLVDFNRQFNQDDSISS